MRRVRIRMLLLDDRIRSKRLVRGQSIVSGTFSITDPILDRRLMLTIGTCRIMYVHGSCLLTGSDSDPNERMIHIVPHRIQE